MAPKTNTKGSHAGPLEATSLRRSESNRIFSRKSRNLAGLKSRFVIVALILDPCQKDWYTCRRKRSTLLRRSWTWRYIAIRKGAEKSGEGIFFVFREFQVAKLSFVEVGCVLGLRPPGKLFPGIACLAFGQDVAGVVKMHHFFQVFEIAIVHVGFHKVWRGTH